MTRDPHEGVAPTGLVRTGVGTAPVRAPYDEVLRTAAAEIAAALGEALHGLYVYGSVATGQARPPGSDLDLYAVLHTPHDDACREATARLSVQFGDVVREVGLATVQLDEVRATSLAGEAERCFIRHYCRHVAGHDLRPGLPDCMASVRLARGFDSNVGQVVDRVVDRLRHDVPDDDVRRLVARGARKLLMAAATLLSARGGGWTTDREAGASLLAAAAPHLQPTVTHVLDWTTLDTDGEVIPPTEQVTSTFIVLRDWLVTAFASAPVAAPRAGSTGATPRALLLDIGGVLADTPETGWVQRWERRLDLPPGGLPARMDPLLAPGEVGTATSGDIRRAVADALGLDPASSDDLWEDLWAEYLGTLNRRLLEHASSLRPGVTVGLLSNSLVGAREREEAAYDLSRHVDAIVYSHEAGLTKPDPRIYLLACERLGVAPNEVVFVDDHEMCVTAARDLGMTGILFTTQDDTIAAIDRALGRG